MKAKKRDIDILVLSDIHLGTYGCRAKELHYYLKSVNPSKVILNGDIIDMWQFSKRYWPKSHMKIIRHIINWMSKGIPVVYITGNHDEMLRKFVDTNFGSLVIVNKLIIELPNKEKAWFFHGDVFDVTMQHSRLLVKVGAISYDLLILLNSCINHVSEKVFKRGKVSLSKRVKQSVKSAVKYINNFESLAADVGIENGFDYVICGHIHNPENKTIQREKGSIKYLNSGDWVEHLTSLEYYNNSWHLYKFSEFDRVQMMQTKSIETHEFNNAFLFQQLVTEFKTFQA